MPVFSRVKSQPRSMTQTRGWRASPSHARDEKLILETVSNYLDTDATREKIRREIRRLANTIVGIEDDFAKISSKLEHLDPSQLIRDFGGVAAKVQEWKAIHNRYTLLTNKSKNTANEMWSRTTELQNVIIPLIGDPRVAMQVKNRSLEKYIKKLHDFAEEGERDRTAFLRLQQDVDNFRETLKKLVPGARVQYATQLEDVDKKIRKLQLEISESGWFTLPNSLIGGAAGTAVGTAAGVASAKGALGGVAGFFASVKGTVGGVTGYFAAGAVGGGSAGGGAVAGAVGSGSAVGGVTGVYGLTALLPSIGIGVAIAVLAARGLSYYELKGKKNQLAELEDERKQLLASLRDLNNISVALDSLDLTFDHLVGRLGALHGIWHLLVTDARRLKSELEGIKNPDDELVLRYRIKGMERVYSALSLALDGYCLAYRNV